MFGVLSGVICCVSLESDLPVKCCVHTSDLWSMFTSDHLIVTLLEISVN